jgi:hypothetical protein
LDKDEEDEIETDRSSKVFEDLPTRIIGRTFNPLENGQLLKRACSKRSWI